MYKKLLALCLLTVTSEAFADWGAPFATIDALYVFPTYVVVVQSQAYAGTAGCLNNAAWSFSWSDFDAQAQQRIYSSLLAARLAKTPIRPVLTDSGCGPEGHKKFYGVFVI